MKYISFMLGLITLFISFNAISAEDYDSNIMFATLNTVVNGDHPDELIDATVIEGRYKGAKLHGKLITTKSESDDLNRMNLLFTSMDVPGESKPINITAYAIDADTARTALTNKVSPDYLQHNSVILAASFLQSNTYNSDHSLRGYPKKKKIQINSGTNIGIIYINS